MKIIELYEKGLFLAGQRQDEEYLITGKETDGLAIINQVFLDLSVSQADSILEERNFTDSQCDAVAFGIAYYLSLHSGNGEKSHYLSQLYNGKRAKALSSVCSRTDTLPSTVR